MLLLEPDDSRFYEQQDDKVGGFGRYLKRVLPYRGILAQAIAIEVINTLVTSVTSTLVQKWVLSSMAL